MILKRIYINLILVLSTFSLFAQLPQGISFQAIVRNGNEQLVANQGIGVRISIQQGMNDTIEMYAETQSVSTTSTGMISIEIGAGNVEKGNLMEIDWSDGNYFIQVDIDPSAAGGKNYTISGSCELVSVPYALHAKVAGHLVGESFESDPLFGSWDKSTGITITKLQVSDLGNYIEIETDPVFSAWNKSAGITITESQISDLGDYIESEIDPLFSAWNKSSGITIGKSQVADLGNYLVQESDPTYAQSAAFNISNAGSGEVITSAERQKLDGIEQGAQQNVKSDWNAGTGDAQILNKPLGVSEFTNDLGLVVQPEIPSAGDMFYYDGASWVSIPKGEHGQLLAVNACGEIVWGNAPSVTTKPANNTVNGTAILYGLVNANNLETVVSFEYGTTTSYGNSILAAQSPLAGSSDVTISASLSGLTIGQTYHFRAKAENALSTVYGHDVSFTITNLTVGDDYAGGKVAYIFQPGDYGYIEGETHGLIVSTSNINNPTHSVWGCNGTVLGGTSTAVGYGKENTERIVSTCPASSGGGHQIAAHVCNNLVRDGYSDWFLPSLGDLTKIYENRELLGTFSADYYWTSSENASIYAYYRHFGTGAANITGKTALFRVRPVRYF